MNTAFERMRQHLTVAGLPNMDLDESRKMIAQTVSGTEGVLHDPAPQVYVATADDSAPKFEVYFWSKPKEAEVLATIDRVATSLRAVTRSVAKDQETKAAEAAQAVQAVQATPEAQPVQAAQAQKAAAQEQTANPVESTPSASAIAAVPSSAMPAALPGRPAHQTV